MVETIYHDHLEPRDTLGSDEIEVTLEEIVRFGEKYHLRPYHVDETAATAAIFGGLVASGAQTLACWNFPRFQTEDRLAQLATSSPPMCTIWHPSGPATACAWKPK